jgi:DNA helicase HerA-like ATPase
MTEAAESGAPASDAELTRLRAEADLAEAELRAAQARAALARAEAAAAAAPSNAVIAEAPAAVPAPASEPTSTDAGATAAGPLSDSDVAAVVAGYDFAVPALELGALVNGEPVADARVRIPLPMLNRHGLIAGATGTGKTRTLQLLVEQLSAHGVPVFAPDIKGDLSGLAAPGEPGEKLLSRTRAVGQDWHPTAFPTEFFTLGAAGAGAADAPTTDGSRSPRAGVPLRATVSGFGPLLLSRVLGLNQTQESSLRLVFHYADEHGLALVDLEDLRAVLTYLTSDEGKPELRDIGGVSRATAGVILRELVAFAEDGADVFFGEPEFDVQDLLRCAPDGRGIVSLLEAPDVVRSPTLFSTFLIYLLAELYEALPEAGDTDKPKLVFYFDEAHLLFRDASPDFLAATTQTVRLIRSKGVGVFFVTQTPKDLPRDVLAQLGSRIQHALRAFTPEDAKALRAAAGTYPSSSYDLERVLQELGTGEAIITVMGEEGVPTPVAWTRLRAPQAAMSPISDAAIAAAVAGSPLWQRYGDTLDPESAREILAARLSAAADAAARDEYERQEAEIRAAQEAADDKAEREYERMLKRTRGSAGTRRSTSRSPLEQVLGAKSADALIAGVIRGVFGTRRR